MILTLYNDDRNGSACSHEYDTMLTITRTYQNYVADENTPADNDDSNPNHCHGRSLSSSSSSSWIIFPIRGILDFDEHQRIFQDRLSDTQACS